MKSNVARRSKEEGFTKSRLPTFTHEEIRNIKGTVDLLGLNYYTTELARPTESHNDISSLEADSEVDTFQPDDWLQTSVPLFRVSIREQIIQNSILLLLI